MTCPQALPALVEILGTVDIDVPPDGAAPNTPGHLRRAPAGVNVTDEMVGKLGPGVWYSYRKTTYTYAGTTSKCLGVVKYDVCQYFQDIEVYVQGMVGTTISLSSYRLPGLKDGDWEVSGVCWGEVINLAEKGGAKFIPIPKRLSDEVSALPTEAGVWHAQIRSEERRVGKECRL